jgi:glycosyltransferase involved in cell wall biosynthesis
MVTRQAPIRVLHIVGGMTRGGVETWLMHVLRNIDHTQFQLDIVVHVIEPQAYDDEVRALGSTIIPCPYTSNPLTYERNFKRILRENGPYDIVHSHVHNYSGWILRVSSRAGVSGRIAHSHNDTSGLKAQANPVRLAYLNFTEQLIRQHATCGLACSQQAAAALFGPDWESDPRWNVLYYGIDLTPFHEQVDPAEVRHELGIPADAFVVGHIGRFVEQKNHQFLIEIASEIYRRDQQFRLVLIGDGPLRPTIEQLVKERGLSNHVIFTGLRSDVPRVMKGAMDVFTLPSLFEGLGIVLIEAQAAGLPCIITDTLPFEADVVKPLMTRLPLSHSASVWADAILAHQGTAPISDPGEALATVEDSPFNIQMSVKRLMEIYHVSSS